MTDKAPEKMTAKRKGSFAAAGLVLGGVALAAGFYTLPLLHRNSPLELVSFSGLPDGTTGDVRLETSNGNRFFAIDSSSPHIGQDTQELVPPYRLHATLKLPGDRYRDFTLAIDKSRSLSVVMDGFEPWDPVSLTIGTQAIARGVPADWSGKLQLDAGLSNSDTTQACVEINSSTGTLAICHDVGGMRAS